MYNKKIKGLNGMAKLQSGTNDLETLFPEIAAEWDYEGNKGLKDGNGEDISTPNKVLVNSNHKVSWQCKNGHPSWQSIIYNRTKGGHGCPYCAKVLALEGETDLQTTHPNIAAEWDYEENGSLTPTNVLAGSSRKVGWKCINGHKWKAIINSRTKMNGNGCPRCGKLLPKEDETLQALYPLLAEQWHSNKNGNLTPNDVSCGSQKQVWWILPYNDPITGKHFDFEWQSMIRTRVYSLRRNSINQGCPFIANHQLWTGFNDLATRHPWLVEQWHPNKNGDLTPDKVIDGSKKKVWWLYTYTDKNGDNISIEWKSRVSDRISGSQIPFSSKGEQEIRKVLTRSHIKFKEQNTFEDRFFASEKYPLKDDFALFDKNRQVVATIEYNGVQHYEPIDFAGKGEKWAKEQLEITRKRDKVKSDYLKANNIIQLIIPYWEFNKINDAVNDLILQLSEKENLFQDRQL